MRLAALLAAVAAAAAVAVSTGTGAPHKFKGPCAKENLNLVKDGQLTIGTDNPAYPPWFGGSPPKGSKWKTSDPTSGKGFESAVAYAVAGQLGFAKGEVEWIYVPFARSYAPGKKSFDFDINQISYTPARARVVSFSAPYYYVNQSIVVRKGTPIARVTTIAGLRKYKLGVQVGTTSYQFIVNTIKPAQKPAVYDTNDKAVFALKSKQLEGVVVDLPTAFYVTAVQVPNSKILGQFTSTGGREYFGMVFQKGNSLVACVNKALSSLRASGQLQKIQQTWLSRAVGAPVLK